MRRALLIILFLAAATAAVVFFGMLGKSGAPAYLTAPAEISRVAYSISATGTLHAVVTVKVSSQLSGRIEKIFVDFNDKVESGQPLAQLERKAFKARVREASAALAVAKSNTRIKKILAERARNVLASTVAKLPVYAAKTSRAHATYVLAKWELERNLSLIKKGHIAEAKMLSAKASHDIAMADYRGSKAEEIVHGEAIATAKTSLLMAEAEIQRALDAIPQGEALLSLAEVNLARTVISSPIDGIVIERNVDSGQTVAANFEAPILFTIAQDLREMEIHVKVDEADIASGRVGQRVDLKVDAFPGRVFHGIVKQIRKAPEVVQNVVTYTMIVSTSNPDLLFFPGMTVLARIVVQERRDVLTVPNASLRFEPTNDFAHSSVNTAVHKQTDDEGVEATVWILDGAGLPQSISLRIGLSDQHATEVISGNLTAGQKVIVREIFPSRTNSLFGLRLGF